MQMYVRICQIMFFYSIQPFYIYILPVCNRITYSKQINFYPVLYFSRSGGLLHRVIVTLLGEGFRDYIKTHGKPYFRAGNNITSGTLSAELTGVCSLCICFAYSGTCLIRYSYRVFVVTSPYSFNALP